MNDHPGFRVRLRGYDRHEVTAALRKLAHENREAWREIDRLSGEVERLQGAMVEQQENERHVQRALVAAEKLADEIRAAAEAEARTIVRDAETQGATILTQLREQAAEMEGQIDFLRARRRDAEASIAALIDRLSKQLELFRPQSDRPDSVEAAEVQPDLSGLARVGCR